MNMYQAGGWLIFLVLGTIGIHKLWEGDVNGLVFLGLARLYLLEGYRK